MKAQMKYTLTTMMLTADEASWECLHPEEEAVNADMYLRALAEDIENIPKVKSVTRDGVVFFIEVEDGMSQSDLELAMKPYFTRGERDCAYRFVSLKPN
jgi:hypothetical protein